MKVKELLEILETKNPDAEVYKEADGYYYSITKVEEDRHGDIVV